MTQPDLTPRLDVSLNDRTDAECRLRRLKEVIGIDYELLRKWRKGAAPGGGPMLSPFLFAGRVPGGLAFAPSRPRPAATQSPEDERPAAQD